MRALVRSWNRYWFGPINRMHAVAFRTATGALLLYFALSLIPDLFFLFGSDALTPSRRRFRTLYWTMFDVWDGDAAAVTYLLALIVASIGMVVGVLPRLSTIVAAIVFVSFERANSLVSGGVDDVLRLWSMYLLFAAAFGGADHLSGRIWRSDDLRTQTSEAWLIRIMQLQLALIYVTSVGWKLRGWPWREGSAVATALSIEGFRWTYVPGWFENSELLIAVSTYGVLTIEALLAPLILFPRTRKLGIILGVMLHLAFGYFLALGLFVPAMLAGYVAIWPYRSTDVQDSETSGAHSQVTSVNLEPSVTGRT